MYNCISFSPIREKIPEDMRYLIISKEYAKPEPRDGKKKVTKEQMEEYRNMIADREKMFNELKIGNVIDMGNRYLTMHDIIKDIHWILCNPADYFIYKIEPINACKCSERYYSSEEFQVSSFKVIKKINNMTELLDDLADTIYYHDAFNEIFKHSFYVNKREYGIKIFKYFNEKHPDKKIYLSDCLYNTLHSYDKHSQYANNDGATNFAQILFNDGLVELIKEFDDHEKVVGELIKAGWYELAIKYINEVKSLDYGKIYFKDKYNNEDVLSAIRLHTDDKNVVEIVDLLNLKDTYTTLIVKEYINDGFDEREIEIKQFKNINEVRSYVIKQYDISFEDAQRDINYWRNENSDIFFEIK